MKVNLTTLGCPKNLVDSEFLLGGLKGDGVELVDDPLQADAIILNTCGFIQAAKEESIEAILQAVQLKNNGACRKVFVTGCLSQRYREELAREIPEVDGFYGNRDLRTVLRQLALALDLKRELLGERHLTTPSHFAYLKISEGCENPCTFCSIPAIRGPFKSRPLEALVQEARRLAEQGVRELILIGQDTTVYGRDLYGETRLIPLLKELVQIDEIKWLRLLYTYPAHFSDELIDFLADHPKINYVDMPIQHVSDRLLRQMARKVTRARIEAILERLRANHPDIALRTSLIVGFPGETDADHFELVEFLEQVRFERLGLFTYSREEDTPAYHFRNQVPEHVKHERWAELNDVQSQISLEKNQELVGTTREVLVDEFDPESGVALARSSWDCPEIDNSVILREQVEQGRFCRVQIVGCSDYDLDGTLVGD